MRSLVSTMLSLACSEARRPYRWTLKASDDMSCVAHGEFAHGPCVEVFENVTK